MKTYRNTRTAQSGFARTTAALSLSVLLLTAACSSDTESDTDSTDTSTNGGEVSQDGTDGNENPDVGSDEPANGTVYEVGDIYPPAVEGEFGYLNLRNAEEDRFLAALAGEEEPERVPRVNILIKHGEPIPASVKDAIEEDLFQQSARVFAGMPDLPADSDFTFNWLDFYTPTNGTLVSLSELSGTYVDIIFPRSMVSEDDYLNYNHYVGVQAWNTTGFEGFTETLEEYLANYEAYLAEEGITDYELWVMEPEVTAPWIQ